MADKPKPQKFFDNLIATIIAAAAGVMIIAYIANYWVLFGLIGLAVVVSWMLYRERQRNEALRADNRYLERDLDRARGRRRTF